MIFCKLNIKVRGKFGLGPRIHSSCKRGGIQRRLAYKVLKRTEDVNDSVDIEYTGGDCVTSSLLRGCVFFIITPEPLYLFFRYLSQYFLSFYLLQTLTSDR